MTNRFGVVVLMPQATESQRVDFSSREFADWEEFAAFMKEVDEKDPHWQAVTVVHIEDLPLLLAE